MSKNRLTLVYSILLLSALLLPTFAVTQEDPAAVTVHSLQGDNQQTYIIPWSVLDAGGKVEDATSANYRLKDAIGQPVIGKCENANYRLYVGFCTIATVVPPKVPITETKYQKCITRPIGVSRIRFVQNAVNEKWVKGSKWPIPMELMYWQKSTKYLIEIDIDENGNVTRVGFRRWGSPVTEIPYDLAEQSLANLPPGFAIGP
jgi:hypothetical protein